MPPSRAESVAPFRARAHAPARARALCTSPLLRFVSCPLSLPPPILLLTHGITRCTYLYLALCLFLFLCRISPLLSYSLSPSLSLSLCVSLFFVSRLRWPPGRSSPVGADTLTFPYQDTPSPTQRNVPPPTTEVRSRAPVVGPATTSCVYPTLSLPTSVWTRISMYARVHRCICTSASQPSRELAPFAENKSEHNR